jgi:branched-chain amino acid transport system ATP-binding protein
VSHGERPSEIERTVSEPDSWVSGLVDAVGSRRYRPAEERMTKDATDQTSVVFPVLSVDDLSVHFGGVAALSHITFEVPQREIMAVVGPNGAGKSTLLNVISGLVRGNLSGRVMLDGSDITRKAPAAIAKAKVGRSFQDPPLIDSETVLENVLLGDHLHLGYRMFDQLWRRRRVRAAELASRRGALEILEITGLIDVKDERAGGLSYGSRKLIDIARAIMSRPQLLLLDEPTSGLDASEQAAAAKVLGELHRATDMSILVVEHHMDVVRSIAGKVLALESGKVIAMGTTSELISTDSVREIIESEGECIESAKRKPVVQ